MIVFDNMLMADVLSRIGFNAVPSVGTYQI